MILDLVVLGVICDYRYRVFIVTMLVVSAMIGLRAALVVALCFGGYAVAFAHHTPARNVPSPDPSAQVMGARSSAAQFVRTRNVPVQNLPPDITREQVLSALGSRDPDIRHGAYIALGVLGESRDLPVLYSALYDNDRLTRKIAEEAIWKVWGRSGNSVHDQMYLHGVEQMQSGNLTGAVGSFSELIELAPDFSEAWNKRATVYFMLGKNELSIADCEEVLAREPNHFGALSGYGLLMLRKRDYQRALGYFEQALTANPNMPGVQRNIRMITGLLEEAEENGV